MLLFRVTTLFCLTLCSLLPATLIQAHSIEKEIEAWIQETIVQHPHITTISRLNTAAKFLEQNAIDSTIHQLNLASLVLKEEDALQHWIQLQILLGKYYCQDLQLYTKASEYLISAQNSFSKEDFPQEYLALSDWLIATHYWQHQTEEAMKRAVEVLALAQEKADKRAVFKFNQWIGKIFAIEGKWKKAIEYYERVRVIALALDEPELKYDAYLHLAAATFKSKEFHTALSYLEDCEIYLKDCPKDIMREADFKTWEGIIRGANEQYEASESILKEVALRYDSLNVPNRRMHTRLELAKVYLSQQKYTACIQKVEEALLQAPKHISIFEQRFAYDLLYEANKGLGKYQLAIKNLELLNAVLSQLDSINNAGTLQEWERKYKDHEQRQIIEQQQIRLEKRKWLKVALGSVTLLLLGMFYIVYVLQKNRQKLATKNVIIENQTKELRKLDELKSSFFTNITHEFRTPLTIIQGMTELGNHPNAMQMIRRNSDRLLQLVNQLLDLSKLDKGKLALDYQQINVIPFLQYISESFQSLAASKQINLLINSNIEELWMDVNEEKLQEIVSNLLFNAIKFTPENGKIKVFIDQKENYLLIEIKDDGMGISELELPYIFDRFYQARQPSDQQGQGTGIGLTLVKELVNLMNAKIEVESQLEKGTTFSILLPITNNASKHIPPQVLLPKQEVLPSEKKSENIAIPIKDLELPQLLLIEDNEDVITYVKALLKSQYQVLTATDGAAGIELAIQSIPDLILSDVMMPKKNGFEVVEILKKDERTSHIPIILLTAKATRADKIAGLKQGADAYLMKPFDREELFVRLEQLIHSRKQLQQKYQTFVPTKKTLKKTEDRFLQKLHELTLQHCSNSNFGVEQLANKLDMSQMQLYRKLKALINKTPIQFIRTIRLQQAKNLLQTSTLNISEIAYEVGFNDPAYFTRVFTKVFGQSPNTYRGIVKTI